MNYRTMYMIRNTTSHAFLRAPHNQIYTSDPFNARQYKTEAAARGGITSFERTRGKCDLEIIECQVRISF